MMQLRKFGRLNWQVSGIGYGMWGMAGWTGADLTETEKALNEAVSLGCNFYDTAWGYGEGMSEQILGRLIKRHPDKKIYAATKIPPKNLAWPSKPDYRLEDVFPAAHIIEYTEKSLKNLNLETIDLQQFHVWEDAWAEEDSWKRTIEKLKQEGKVQGFGISVNRWEPNNCIATLQSGLIDSIQVIYNIFDQAPEDQLFQVCEALDVAIIARVPFDEGTLTGNLTKETTFPEGDWRNLYFVPENLIPSVERADLLKTIVPEGMTMPEMALRFILNHPAVSTTIPGMRKMNHVKANIAAGDDKRLDHKLLAELKNHRWDRIPTSWSH
jgi:aryl-alcohol dehydrogenase-like predicted oxidoreductase